MKIALAGNPNSGKTTLYNALTGKIEKIGNWAGVTIEKKESMVKRHYNTTGEDLAIVDLPGAYSLSPFTSEESITRDFIMKETPDVIINIVDATNLSRGLFFTTQLLELEIPLVLALNKTDLLAKKEKEICVAELGKSLGCPVIETIATKSKDNGLTSLISTATAIKGKAQTPPFTSNLTTYLHKEDRELADKTRYTFVNNLVSKVEIQEKNITRQTKQDAADRFIAHKWFGLPIFAVVMWSVFSISQTHLGPLLADLLAGMIDSLYTWVAGMLGEGVSPVLRALLLDGIIGGVGAVIGFLPLIMVLFFLLALLEDCGYMARVAVVMDRFFKRVGLSGKSIIPMIIGTGCAIPGIMATRTIRNTRQRRTTAMLTPFMPCGAKLPVIALFAGIFFDDAAWVGTFMYFLGIAIIVFGALLVMQITGEKHTKSFFIVELPDYRFPSIKRATISMLSRAKSFIVKAGTIILLCNAAIQIMQTFNWKLQVVADGAANTSILASIASPFAILMIPLGFGAWQLAAAAITGFIAKENVVGTLAVVYSITNFIDPEELALISGGASVANIMGLSSAAALSYLVFNLFTPPCFAAIGAMNAEMESRKWLWGGIGFQFGMGYVVAFFVYQLGTLFTTGLFGTGFIPGLIGVSVFLGILLHLVRKGSVSEEESLKTAA
jgi:ferrous iron transport protein B